jgi:hypothetical protein
LCFDCCLRLVLLQNGASDARHDHMHRLKDMAVKQATGAQLKLAAAGRSISRRFG